MERIPFELAPSFHILVTVMEEVKHKFLYAPVTSETIHTIEDYFNNRVEHEIAVGNYRETFITPDNRLAVYEGIVVKRDEFSDNSVKVVPVYKYKDTNK